MRGLTGIFYKSDTYLNRVSSVFGNFAGGVMLALGVLVTVDVILRYIFSHPIPGGAESTELFLDYIVFLGLAYALLMGGHVRVTMILDRLKPRMRLGAESLDCIIGMACFGLLSYVSYLHFWESFIVREFMMAPVKLPYWVGKLAMSIGYSMFCLQFFFLFLGFIYFKKRGKV